MILEGVGYECIAINGFLNATVTWNDVVSKGRDFLVNDGSSLPELHLGRSSILFFYQYNKKYKIVL